MLFLFIFSFLSLSSPLFVNLYLCFLLSRARVGSHAHVSARDCQRRRRCSGSCHRSSSSRSSRSRGEQRRHGRRRRKSELLCLSRAALPRRLLRRREGEHEQQQRRRKRRRRRECSQANVGDSDSERQTAAAAAVPRSGTFRSVVLLRQFFFVFSFLFSPSQRHGLSSISSSSIRPQNETALVDLRGFPQPRVSSGRAWGHQAADGGRESEFFEIFEFSQKLNLELVKGLRSFFPSIFSSSLVTEITKRKSRSPSRTTTEATTCPLPPIEED